MLMTGGLPPFELFKSRHILEYTLGRNGNWGFSGEVRMHCKGGKKIWCRELL